MERDWDAVVQGLTSPWNAGPVEDRVNHIKMLKRQMYGRASLPLLRKRVLLTAAHAWSSPDTASTSDHQSRSRNVNQNRVLTPSGAPSLPGSGAVAEAP